MLNMEKLPGAALSLLRTVYRLQKKMGYCWATNKQLAEWMRTDKPYSAGYISHLLTALDRRGFIVRHITTDPRGEFVCRQMVAFLQPQAAASKAETLKKLEEDRSEKGNLARLAHNAVNVGLRPLTAYAAAKKFGAAAVERALIVLHEHKNYINNPIKYFFAALHGDWKPSEKAEKRYFGKAFSDVRRVDVYIPVMDTKELGTDWRQGALFNSLSERAKKFLLSKTKQ